jgi:glycerol uptake facilitator-like aquaporin
LISRSNGAQVFGAFAGALLVYVVYKGVTPAPPGRPPLLAVGAK